MHALLESGDLFQIGKADFEAILERDSQEVRASFKLKKEHLDLLEGVKTNVGVATKGGTNIIQ